MIYAQAERFLNKKVLVVTDLGKVIGTLYKCDTEYGFILTLQGEDIKAPLQKVFPR
mgnify:CR=1 FL=1|jgi:hypothetical protein